MNVDKSKLLARILLRAEKEGRSDDKEDVFNDRLEIYNKAEKVILENFSNVIEIDGDRAIEEVSEDIKNKFED